MDSLLSICMNENTSFTKMGLLNSFNARTDHDVRLNKLSHKRSMTSNLIPSSDFVAKKKFRFRLIRSNLVSMFLST